MELNDLNKQKKKARIVGTIYSVCIIICYALAVYSEEPMSTHLHRLSGCFLGMCIFIMEVLFAFKPNNRLVVNFLKGFLLEQGKGHIYKRIMFVLFAVFAIGGLFEFINVLVLIFKF